MEYTVDVTWDDEAEVWCAVCDDIPLATESDSFDLLLERIKTIAHEILELNGKPTKVLRRICGLGESVTWMRVWRSARI